MYRACLAPLVLAGCTPLPSETAARGLYSDARKIVELRAAADWVSDRVEIEEASTSLLRSACLSPEQTHLETLRWVEARLANEADSLRARWLAAGRDLEAVGEALTLERVAAVLRRSAERVQDGECPFWLEPDPAFAGVHGDEGRLVVWFESGGGAALLLGSGRAALGGGGGARALLGHGAGARATLAAGVELGAVAAFPEDARGTRTVAATLAGAVPLVLRMRDGLRVLDVEAAATLRWRSARIEGPGIRTTVGIGFSTLRTRGLMPHALLWLGHEWFAAADGSAEHALRVGTRVGLDWDP
ncbi:MAG: hypothetical protein NZ898_16825 [Myxococcota bacterium]|nr:hypothetical protein [Myxococcota bacterium]MDW8360937.1 hypothetical protein [Myxococcales bacterium]